MPVNFDYFCGFIDIFDDGPACARTRDFVTPMIVRVGCYLSHCSCKDQDLGISRVMTMLRTIAEQRNCESRKLEGESNSDENDVEKLGNI
ncbi:hypothetical protein TNCV_4928931 [Trichonephila clavipes]|nr:hypothetical protein TNCV_4928931 [Trichonephila clavipes]